MEIIIDQKKIIKFFEDVYRCINQTNPFVILRNFLLIVDKDKLIIQGNEGLFSIQNTIFNDKDVLEVIKEGKILVSSKLFLNILKKCKNKVVLKTNEQILIIENDKDVFEIALSNIEEFNSLDFNLYGYKISLNSSLFNEAIKKVEFAASKNDEEIILNGINFWIKPNENKLIITATDSFRLSQQTLKFKTKEVQQDEINLTGYSKIIKNLIPADLNADIDIYFNDHKIMICNKKTIYQCKLIDAPYKDIQNVFSLNVNKKLFINKKLFLDALEKAIILNNESFNKINLIISNKEIVFSTAKNQIGRAKIIIENDEAQTKYQYIAQEDIDIVFNFKFLKEAIENLKDNIYIQMNNSNSPIIIQENEDSLNKQLVAPTFK